MKKTNKKGSIDDFGSFAVAGTAMVIIMIAAMIFVSALSEGKQRQHETITALHEASYTTRVLLDWELENGKKVHEALIKYNKENNLEGFIKEMQTLLQNANLIPQHGWFIVIETKDMDEPIVQTNLYSNNDEEFQELDELHYPGLRSSFIQFSRVHIPDGQHNIIQIAIKEIKDRDIDIYEDLMMYQEYKED